MSEPYNPAKDEKKLRQIINVGHHHDMPSRWVRCLAGEVLTQNARIASLEAQVKTQDAIINDTSAIITRMVYHADDSNPLYVMIGMDVFYELEDMYAPPTTEQDND